MVPASVPIVDYESPFYCPNALHVRSVNGTRSGVDHSVASLSSNTLASNHEDAPCCKPDTRTSSNPDTHASGHPVVGRKLAHIPYYDSSPCARYISSTSESIPSGIPDGEHREHCAIKHEHSSPTLPAFSYQDERIHQVPKEDNGGIPAWSLGGIVTTRSLLLRIDQVFPRAGFREAADSSHNIWSEINAQYRSERHQALVDELAERGALNEYVLTLLYDAEFHHLDLGPTMRGVNKLNLPLGDVMRVFNHPWRFRHLKTLSFAGAHFANDFSLTHIRLLLQIEKLILADTGIGNEGVFHIVALKHNLRYLDLSGNLSINDDSIPALILFENLQYLSLFGTGTSMLGLRKLAVAIKAGGRVVDVKIPSASKDYIDVMHKQYLLHPLPPLISDPGFVSTLSKAALAGNLKAHAAVNSSIIYTGPRNEMRERLRRILDTRNLDLVVREVLGGKDEAK